MLVALVVACFGAYFESFPLDHFSSLDKGLFLELFEARPVMQPMEALVAGVQPEDCIIRLRR